MLMGMGTMVSAAEKESSIPEYSETNDGGMTVNIAGDQEGTMVAWRWTGSAGDKHFTL